MIFRAGGENFSFSSFLENPLHHPAGKMDVPSVMEFQPIDRDRVVALRGCNKVCRGASRNPSFDCAQSLVLFLPPFFCVPNQLDDADQEQQQQNDSVN